VSGRAQYERREATDVVAVRLELDTDGFTYQKWGGEQVCKRGDWLVDNAGDVYTVDAESFARTYTRVSRGLYRKTAPVWAEQAASDGEVKTKEGATHYQRGDWLVFNTADGTDGYAMDDETFRRLYRKAGDEADATR
jgi:hypothetical protein